jgi:predicted RNA methylase
MKYKNWNLSLSTEERERYNDKIASQIYRNSKSLEPEEVYNRYTGKGKLRHLDQNNFSSYYDYAEAKRSFEQGQFFTPHALCEAIINTLKPQPDFKIADLSCGMGNFFNFLPNEENVYGNEIDYEVYHVCKYLYPNAHITNYDFIYYPPTEKFDIVLGNPPFNFNTDLGISQWAYILKAMEVLKYGGLLCSIVPGSFLSDDFQDWRKINQLNEHFHFVAQCSLPACLFNAEIETKLLILQKKGVRKDFNRYHPKTFIAFEPEVIYNEYIQHIYTENKINAPKLRLLAIQDSIGNRQLNDRINKCLWHIKSNPALNKKYYKKLIAKLEEIKTQKKPKDLTDKEWERVKLTPEKVLHSMVSILKHQNDPKHKKELRLVKTNSGIKYKAYHKALQNSAWEKSVHDLLLSGERFVPYRKLYDRKEKALSIQNTPFTDLERTISIDLYLKRLRLVPKWQKTLLYPHLKPAIIQLNEMQRQDLGLLLQKRFAILAWEQGAGKSVAGMTWLRYWQGKYRYCFLLAPALAINTTWTERLAIYGFDYIQIESLQDIYKIKPGQVVLISYDRLISLQRHIKKFIKCAAYKIALLVDESDELTNANSQRSLAALNCFRKAALKLLTTGTTTRNTINELYTQLELVYNNSTAFRCWAETIYKTDDNGNIYKVINDKYGYPFPAYHGAALFKASFCPQRISVFGIRQDTQDIYNSELLKEIISKTIITRKFEEIVKEKKYSIHTHAIKQSPTERELYKLLMTEFLSVCYDYYTTTGNSRKEAALRLIRQIKALIKATSVPHLMANYSGSNYPEKFQEIAKLIKSWPDELVTVGCIYKTTARSYYSFLKEKFPTRKIFYIDGEQLVTKRKDILEEFRLSENGILVCTQQSLKSSVNIPYCNKCIIESLQWNIPKISQFYFRFIRFDSERHTEVHFINYQNTIEINLLALLMAKEKLNDFIKTTNEKTSAAIYEQFGIDLNILDMLITKDWDEEGHLTLRWGNQVMY